MNNNRRKRIRKILDDLSGAHGELEDILNEEQEAFDNLPENLVESEQGEKMEEAASSLEDVVVELEHQITILEEVIDT